MAEKSFVLEHLTVETRLKVEFKSLRRLIGYFDAVLKNTDGNHIATEGSEEQSETRMQTILLSI